MAGCVRVFLAFGREVVFLMTNHGSEFVQAVQGLLNAVAVAVTGNWEDVESKTRQLP